MVRALSVQGDVSAFEQAAQDALHDAATCSALELFDNNVCNGTTDAAVILGAAAAC